MTFEEYKQKLAKYVPQAAAQPVTELFYERPIELRITKDRSSKLGDYRPPYAGRGHRISVNGTLHPYAFLLTLIHEFAHYVVNVNHGTRVKPHGKEWKDTFKELMLPFLNPDVYPDEVLRPLSAHMKNPAASSSTDIALRKAMQVYEAKSETLLEDLPDGAIFSLRNSRIFQRGKKFRTRYQCKELTTGKMYRINGLAEVELIKE